MVKGPLNGLVIGHQVVSTLAFCKAESGASWNPLWFLDLVPPPHSQQNCLTPHSHIPGDEIFGPSEARLPRHKSLPQLSSYSTCNQNIGTSNYTKFRFCVLSEEEEIHKSICTTTDRLILWQRFRQAVVHMCT